MPKYISIIICTHNRPHLLKRTLCSLARQTLLLEEFEVIVVDDGSDANTTEVIDLMRQNLPNMKYVSTGKNIGVGSARNLGIRLTRGEYILFTDDDCIPEENWAARMRTALDREPIVVGAIISSLSKYINLCQNISFFHPFLPGRKTRTKNFIAGANMGFNRSILDLLKSFQEGRRVAEDTELALRARQEGYRIYFASDAIVKHDPENISVTNVFKKTASHASATILLRNQYRLLLRTPFLLCSPVLILLAAPAIALWTTLGIYLGNTAATKLIHTAPVVYMLKLAWCWGAARGLLK